jgi:hypothetical protein
MLGGIALFGGNGNYKAQFNTARINGQEVGYWESPELVQILWHSVVIGVIGFSMHPRCAFFDS